MPIFSSVFPKRHLTLPYNNTAIETLVNTLKDPDTGAVFGRQIPKQDTSLFGKHLRYFNYPEYSYHRILKDKEKYGIKTAFFSDSFSAYKKRVLEDVGWFKNNLIVGEDMHIAAWTLSVKQKGKGNATSNQNYIIWYSIMPIANYLHFFYVTS